MRNSIFPSILCIGCTLTTVYFVFPPTQAARLGYVLNTLQDEPEEPRRMRFSVNQKVTAEREFSADEDGQHFQNEPEAPQCFGGREEEVEYSHSEGDGAKSRFSVAKVERFLKMLEPIKDPIKALFGIGLLMHGRSFAHLILFTQVQVQNAILSIQEFCCYKCSSRLISLKGWLWNWDFEKALRQAFKVTGFPILAKAGERMKARYLRHLRGLDKENANPLALLLASVDPDSLSLLLQGLYSGAEWASHECTVHTIPCLHMISEAHDIRPVIARPIPKVQAQLGAWNRRRRR